MKGLLKKFKYWYSHPKHNCPGCKVKPGQFHKTSCKDAWWDGEVWGR